jgi:Tfp pilus assembly protein PilO
MSRRAPIIAAAAFAVVAVLAVLFLVRPKMKDVSATNEQVASAQDQATALRAELASLKEAQANAPQVQGQIAQFKDAVPPTADLPGLIRQLTLAADESGVDFFTMTPGTPTLDPSGQFSVITTGISVTGTYFALDQYLFHLETLPRAAKVSSISISTGGGTGAPGVTTTNQLSMQLSANFYTTDTSAGPGSSPGPSGPGSSPGPATGG